MRKAWESRRTGLVAPAPAAEALEVSVRRDPPQAWVRVSGEIDQDSAPQLRDVVDKLLAERPARLHLDMRGVSFSDSCGLHALVDTRRKMREWHGELTVAPSRCVLQLLELTGTTALFTHT
jgi:anti-sigma B factor antagonist